MQQEQPKHTKGELKIADGTDIYFEGHMVAITNPCEGANFFNPEIAQANAQHIVRCWNMHDELIRFLHTLIHSDYPHMSEWNNHLNEAKKILNQSNTNP